MRTEKKNPLAEIRNQKGLTQQELSAMSGVGISTIQLWEAKGTLAASVRNLAKVAKALDVELSELLPA